MSKCHCGRQATRTLVAENIGVYPICEDMYCALNAGRRYTRDRRPTVRIPVETVAELARLSVSEHLELEVCGE